MDAAPDERLGILDELDLVEQGLHLLDISKFEDSEVDLLSLHDQTGVVGLVGLADASQLKQVVLDQQVE